MTNEQLNVKYVDLQGLRFFVKELKKWLKSHVVETDIYKELLYRIENSELYKIVATLPEEGDEDVIYLLRNPNEEDKNLFIEYLYSKEHGWENIGKFIPNIKLEEYLKIEDSPFEKGEGKNSAVLKSSGLNTAKGTNSVAFGKAVVVNCNNGSAFGQNNVGNTNSIFEVGVGSDDRHRKNAYEITTDGKHYIYNLGGYDGTNPTSTNDLATHIKSLETRIQQLEDKLNEITTDDEHYIYNLDGYNGTNDLATHVKSLETRIQQLEDKFDEITTE